MCGGRPDKGGIKIHEAVIDALAVEPDHKDDRLRQDALS
jgi:hypothetical protein